VVVEKVIVVALAQGDVGPVDVGRLLDRAGALDPDRYPSVSMQVEDADATDRWEWRRPPTAWRPLVTVAAWTDCADDVVDLAAVVADVTVRWAGYVVTEAVPRRGDRIEVPVGSARPGLTVTSMLKRAGSLDRDAFLRHWYEVHMPMSLRIHPQHTYVRNVVSRVLTPDAPSIDAICEEGLATVDDLLDPARFFGADPDEPDWTRSRALIGADVPQFLDPDGTLTSLMNEYPVRNAPFGG